MIVWEEGCEGEGWIELELACNMAGHEGVALGSTVGLGNMVFVPILEEGVFRFDCSVDDRNAAFPSISFEDPLVRDTPIMNVHKIPTYVPNFECAMGQQVVNLEVIFV